MPKSLTIIFFLIIFLVTGKHLYPLTGSEKQRQLHFFYPGIRINYERDPGYSPLIYKGIQPSFSIAYSVSKTGFTNLYITDFSSGNISNKWNNKVHVYNAGIQIFKFYHREKDPVNGLLFGWSNNNEYNTRETDNGGNFKNRNEYFTSFGPAIHFSKPLLLFNRQFYFKMFAHTQLVGFKLQSSYVTSLLPGFEEPSKNGISALLYSLEPFHPYNSMNFGIRPGFDYEFRQQSRLTISYHYDYLRLTGAHMVEKSRGTWFAGIITRI